MRRGFTLIEIMVVIAIVAIVAAILFPVFSKAKEKSLETASIGNMRQLYIAIETYRQDYESAAFGTMEEMGLPPAPNVQYLGTSVADLRPPRLRRGTMYYYYPAPAWIDHRLPTWKDYVLEHAGRTVVLADAWFNPERVEPPYIRYIDDPDVPKYMVGIALDGGIRRKRASGHLDMAWWSR